MNDYLDYIVHSAKGSTWHKKKHKYLFIKNGRYYYKYDLGRNAKKLNNEGLSNILEDIYEYGASDGKKITAAEFAEYKNSGLRSKDYYILKGFNRNNQSFFANRKKDTTYYLNSGIRGVGKIHFYNRIMFEKMTTDSALDRFKKKAKKFIDKIKPQEVTTVTHIEISSSISKYDSKNVR